MGASRRVQLVDNYEMETISGVRLTIPIEASESVALQMIRDRLAIAFPKMSREFAESYLNFDKEAVFLYGVNLERDPDTNPIAIPRTCEVRQVVIQKTKKHPNDKLFLVNSELWSLLAPRDKVAIVLHEFLYQKYLGSREAVKSVRMLTGLYGTDMFPRSAGEIAALGSRAPMYWLETSSIRFLNVPESEFNWAYLKGVPTVTKIIGKEWLMDGPWGPMTLPLERRWVDLQNPYLNLRTNGPTELISNGEPYWAREFYTTPEGKPIAVLPHEAVLNRNANVGDSSYQLNLSWPHAASVYPNGNFHQMRLDRSGQIKVGRYSFEWTEVLPASRVELSPSGEVIQFSIPIATTELVDINRSYVIGGDNPDMRHRIGFYPGAKALRYFSTHQKNALLFKWWGGSIEVSKGEVYENGQIKRSFDRQSLKVGDQYVKMREVVFAPSGAIRAGNCVEDTQLRKPNGDTVVVPQDHSFWLDEHERVIATAKYVAAMPGIYFADIPYDPVPEIMQAN